MVPARLAQMTADTGVGDTGVGDPRAATPERGAAFVDAAARRIADFLVELAAMDPSDPYA